MPVQAIQAIRRMHGGTQSQLMLGADDRLWVVKFQNNPQHVRILANELIATTLAHAVGLSVPAADTIYVAEELVSNDSSMRLELSGGRETQYLSGVQFGSAYVGGLLPGLVVEVLSDKDLATVLNVNEFLGMLAFDKWTCNCDGRQAVFYRAYHEPAYKAAFIDHGFCFNAGAWNFPDMPLRGVYARAAVYRSVVGWSSFEPWLSRIEETSLIQLLEAAAAVPRAWYGNDQQVLEQLMLSLFDRRFHVRELIASFRDSERNPFPLWTAG